FGILDRRRPGNIQRRTPPELRRRSAGRDLLPGRAHPVALRGSELPARLQPGLQPGPRFRTRLHRPRARGVLTSLALKGAGTRRPREHQPAARPRASRLGALAGSAPEDAFADGEAPRPRAPP